MDVETDMLKFDINGELNIDNPFPTAFYKGLDLYAKD